MNDFPNKKDSLPSGETSHPAQQFPLKHAAYGRHSRKEKRGKGIAFWLSIGLNVLLCTILGITTVQFYNYRQAAVAVDNLLTESDPQGMEEYVQDEEEMVSVASLKYYAQKHNVSIEFLQNFFPDVIVYKDSSGIVYSPIDPALPKNRYEWKNLVRENGRFQYQQDGEVTSLTGVDVSRYQGEIDWEKVKADGIDFAILRLGARGYETGKLVLDETFHQNAKGALAAGLDIGVYFYTQATTVAEAEEEADFVLAELENYDIAYPVIFDTEDPNATTARTNGLTPTELTDIAIAFCDRVQESGYRPMLYANIKWFVANLELSRLTQYDKWFAQYFKQPFFPYEFQMWQYTSTGTVDGIQGDVDLNVCFTDYANDTREAESGNSQN